MAQKQKTIAGVLYKITDHGYVYCAGQKLNNLPLHPLYDRIPTDLSDAADTLCRDWMAENYEMGEPRCSF